VSQRASWLAAASVAALAASACSPSPDGAGGALVITGSSTIAPLVAEIAQRYEREHAGVRRSGSSALPKPPSSFW